MKLLQVLILLVLSFACLAGVEYKKFDDPVKEQAYKVLISELRCLVCQNQTIASSNAALAVDLRRQVYEMLQQGKSQEQIVEFMIQRYGDFVMYNPPFKAKTSFLWLGPALFLLTGLVLLVVLSKRKKSIKKIESNDDKEVNLAKVRSLLDDNGEQS